VCAHDSAAGQHAQSWAATVTADPTGAGPPGQGRIRGERSERRLDAASRFRTIASRRGPGWWPRCWPTVAGTSGTGRQGVNDPHARSAGRRFQQQAGSFTPCLRICSEVQGPADGTLRRLGFARGLPHPLGGEGVPAIAHVRPRPCLDVARPLATAMAEDNLWSRRLSVGSSSAIRALRTLRGDLRCNENQATSLS